MFRCKVTGTFWFGFLRDHKLSLAERAYLIHVKMYRTWLGDLYSALPLAFTANLLPPPRKMRYKKPGYCAKMTMHVLSLQSNVSSYQKHYKGALLFYTWLGVISAYLMWHWQFFNGSFPSASFLVPEMVISDSKIGFSWLFSVFLLDTSCST